MRENRPSGLMRGGKQTVIGFAFHSVASCLLYTQIIPNHFSPFGSFFVFYTNTIKKLLSKWFDIDRLQ